MPSYLGFDYTTPLTVTSNQPELSVDTLNLRRQSISTNQQRWELRIGLGADNGSSGLARTIMNDRTVKGGSTTFTMPMPQFPETDALVANTTTATTSAAGAVGDTSITITATGSAPAIPLGRYVKFASHTKVYLVTANYTGASGTLNIFPALTNAVTDATAVTFGTSTTPLVVSVRYDLGGIARYQYDDGIISAVTLRVVENLT